MNVFKNEICYTHPNYKEFIKKFDEAIFRDCFNREKPRETTITSPINSSKYIIEFEEKIYFVNTPNIYFEVTLDFLWNILKNQGDEISDINKLLLRLYNSVEYRKSIENFEYLICCKSIDDFIYFLKEESYFYFTDNENEYYFNLFRDIKNKEFVGGILHSLIKHFEVFNKLHETSNDSNKFQYNSIMNRLIECSLYGEVYTQKELPNGNSTINKRILVTDQYLNVVLYWDDYKKLYFLTTAYYTNN